MAEWAFAICRPSRLPSCRANLACYSRCSTAEEGCLRAVGEVCWDHPLAFLRGRVRDIGDPRAVAVALFVAVSVLC